MFFFLTNLIKVQREFVNDAIESNIEKIDYNQAYKLSEEIKNYTISKLKEIKAPLTEKISQFVLNLNEYSSIGCLPQHI